MKNYQLILLGVVFFGLGGYLIATRVIVKTWDYENLTIKSVNNPIPEAVSLIGKKTSLAIYFENNTSKEYITGFQIANTLVSRILSERAGVKIVSFGIVNEKCIPPYSSNTTNSTTKSNNTLFDRNDPIYLDALHCKNPVIVIQSGPCNCIKIDKQITIEGDSSFLNSQEIILSIQDFFLEVAARIKNS